MAAPSNRSCCRLGEQLMGRFARERRCSNGRLRGAAELKGGFSPCARHVQELPALDFRLRPCCGFEALARVLVIIVGCGHDPLGYRGKARPVSQVPRCLKLGLTLLGSGRSVCPLRDSSGAKFCRRGRQRPRRRLTPGACDARGQCGLGTPERAQDRPGNRQPGRRPCTDNRPASCAACILLSA